MDEMDNEEFEEPEISWGKRFLYGGLALIMMTGSFTGALFAAPWNL